MGIYVYAVSPVPTVPFESEEGNGTHIIVGDRCFYYERPNTGWTSCSYSGILFRDLIAWAKKSPGILLYTDDPEMDKVLIEEGVFYDKQVQDDPYL